MAIRRRNSWTSDLNWVGEMRKYAKHISRWTLSTFWGVPARWNIRLYPKTMPRNRPKFWSKSQGGRHVENLETFWMNNKTIYWIWLSYDVTNYADLGGCYSPCPSAAVDNILLDLHNSSHPTQPHSVMFCKLSQLWLSLILILWTLFDSTVDKTYGVIAITF